MLLDQVPSARSDQQRRSLLIQAVLLAFRTGVSHSAIDGIAKIDLTLYVVLPCRRVGILKVSHEHARARVERIDDHFAIHRSGDLDAAVFEIFRNGGNSPGAA